MSLSILCTKAPGISTVPQPSGGHESRINPLFKTNHLPFNLSEKLGGESEERDRQR